MILVTGGKGFLGQVLTQKLVAQGHAVISPGSNECDFSKEAALAYLRSISPKYIFHLAGKTGIPMSWQNPAAFYQANVDTTRILLEYCRENKTPIHYVSAYIYGNQGPYPISEEARVEPNNPYAHSKWIAEELCRFYHRFYSVPMTISRPFNIYGPGQSPHFFIPRILSLLRTQETVKVLDLTPKRDYVFVDDVADALIAIMRYGLTGNCYNIGTGLSFSCKEVIALMQSLLGTQKSVLSDEKTRPEEISHAQANRDKLTQTTGWVPRYSLVQGLTKCLSQNL